MKTLIVLLLAIGVTFASSDHHPVDIDWSKVFRQPTVEKSNNFESRISGGIIAGPTEFPYAVGVLISLVDGPSYCSGALISSQWVLTAASCVKMKNPTITILVGAHDITKALEYIPVVTVKVHEKYSSIWDSNDIALLKMERPAKLNERVKPVKLPRRSHQDMTFKKYLATIIGWGTTGRGSGEAVPMLNLRYVRNSVITNFSCKNSYPLYVSSSNICSSTDNGAACVGDEGSPVVVVDKGELILVGIHSYGWSLGCDRMWPSVHTRVTEYLTWIQNNSGIQIEL